VPAWYEVINISCRERRALEAASEGQVWLPSILAAGRLHVHELARASYGTQTSALRLIGVRPRDSNHQAGFCEPSGESHSSFGASPCGPLRSQLPTRWPTGSTSSIEIFLGTCLVWLASALAVAGKRPVASHPGRYWCCWIGLSAICQPPPFRGAPELASRKLTSVFSTLFPLDVFRSTTMSLLSSLSREYTKKRVMFRTSVIGSKYTGPARILCIEHPS